MWRRLLNALIAGMPLLFAGPAAAPWSFEAALGAAYSVDSRLTIDQAGFDRLEFTPGYRTRPFDTPLYYGLRLSRRESARAWELSVIHHKLYPVDTPGEVRDFSISHGYNLVTVNRACAGASGLTWRLGAGAVVTHAEGTVRGVRYNGPYDLAGPALLFGVSRRFYFSPHGFVALDGALTLGDAKAESDGPPKLDVRAPNAAVHALLGVGRDF